MRNKKSPVRSNVVSFQRKRKAKPPASRDSPRGEGVTRILEFPQAGTAAAYAAFVVQLAAANGVPLGFVYSGREMEMILAQPPGNDDEPAVTAALLKTALGGA